MVCRYGECRGAVSYVPAYPYFCQTKFTATKQFYNVGHRNGLENLVSMLHNFFSLLFKNVRAFEFDKKVLDSRTFARKRQCPALRVGS